MDMASASKPAPGGLAAWLARRRRIFVLTGAGCSTNSGIADYRDADGAWKRRPPVTFQAFSGDPQTYRRYWARSSVGWPRFAAARPNGAHAALLRLEEAGLLSMLVTQNVDGLHQRAGSRAVVDLHGRLDEVVCLDCGLRQPRDAVQATMARANPGWQAAVTAFAPDGDADIGDEAVSRSVAPRCPGCGGPVKPDVVFFGENVPRERVLRAQRALQSSDAMLVAGSSLMVYSGFRFARMAAEAGLPLAIVNRGRTRADALATLRVEDDVGEALASAAAELIPAQQGNADQVVCPSFP